MREAIRMLKPLRTAARSSRASGCSRRCCSRRDGWTRRSGSRSRRVRPSAPTTSRRTRRPGSRSASCAPRRAGTTRPRRCCARPSRSSRPTGFRRHRDRAARRRSRGFLRARGRERRGGRGRRGARRARGAGPGRHPRLSRAWHGPATSARARIALIAWLDASSGDSEITVAGRSKRAERLAQRLGAQRALAVGQVVLLVPVRVGDVGEVDVERRAGLEHVVRPPRAPRRTAPVSR